MRHNRTFNGGMVISADNKKFGNSSWLFDGSNDYVSIPTHTDFDFGAGDFTIDWWEYRTASTASKTSIARHNIGLYPPFMCGYSDNITPGNLAVFMSSNGSSYDIASYKSLGAISLNTWVHLAVVRSGTTFYAFKNGVQTDTWTSALPLPSDANPLVIGTGQGNPGNYFIGYIDEIRISKGIARWTSNFTPPDQPYDPDQYTVFLSHCEADMVGTNAHTMTTVGTPVMSPLAPNSNYGGSLTFDGASYISFATSTDWQFGASDFTVDGYIKPGAPAASYSNIIGFVSGTGTGWASIGWTLVYKSTGKLGFDMSDNGGTGVQLIGTTTLTPGTWYHVAIVRIGNRFDLYINGVSEANTTSAITCQAASFNLFMGAQYDTAVYFTGSTTGFRVSKLARWTSAFTPPNTPYSKPIGGIDGYTKLMLQFNNGNNSTVISDSSLTPKTATITNVVQKSDQMMFGRSCGYFGVNNANLSFAASSDWDYGTSTDFTWDFWFRQSGGSGTAYDFISANGSGGYRFFYQASNGGIRFNRNGYASSTISWTPTAGVWYHFALERYGSTITLYINGTAVGTYANDNPADSGSQPLIIGDNSSTYYHMDELRISKGIARYTTNFTPPTKPYDTPAVDAYTKLLLHMNGTNGSTQVPDSGATGYSVTPAGTAQISTTAYKFGGSSLLLDGNSDYLSIPDSIDWELGTSDFTFDGWVNFNVTSGDQVFIGQWTHDNIRWQFFKTGSSISFYVRHAAADQIVITATWAPVTGVWYHVAAVRSGTTYMLFVNGVSLSLTSNYRSSDDIYNQATNITVGAQNGGSCFNGYMQEWRYSKGVARWATNFAPPVRPYGS